MYLFIIFIWISHFMFFLANDLLVTAYFIFILDYRNVRQKSKFNRFFHSSSKWVVKQQRQLSIWTMHLAQELLMNIQCSGGSRGFAKGMTVLKMRSAVAGHWKLTMTKWEDHWSWSYNYMRNCQRTQGWPFYSHLLFEANWKGEKAW